MNEGLKPCPFCGGKAEENYAQFDQNWFGVNCTVCDAYVYDCDSQDAATKKWNKRTEAVRQNVSHGCSGAACGCGEGRLYDMLVDEYIREQETRKKRDLEIGKMIAALILHCMFNQDKPFVPHDAEGEKPGGINQKCCR